MKKTYINKPNIDLVFETTLVDEVYTFLIASETNQKIRVFQYKSRLFS